MSRSTRSGPCPAASTAPVDLDLVALAHALLPAAPDRPLVATLVGVVTPPPATGSPAMVRADLPGPDPVATLLGFDAPGEWSAIGLCAPSTARILDDPRTTPGPGSLVHLLDRGGRAVTVTSIGVDVMEIGPRDVPDEGRVPDLCRRALGLSTAPPPPDMGTLVIDAWLGAIARRTLHQPGLSWAACVALHPGRVLLGDDPAFGSGEPTPAAMARATDLLGTQADWERYRQVCARGRGEPLSGLPPADAEWLDAGSFARWVLGEVPSWLAMMDLLEGALSAAAVDRLWATLGLCPAPTWPPTGQSRG